MGRALLVSLALLALPCCGGAGAGGSRGGAAEGELDAGPLLVGAIDGLDDVFDAPRPLPDNPYVVVAARDRLVKDLAVLDIAPLDMGGPRGEDDSGRMKRLKDRDIVRRERRKEGALRGSTELEELCSLSSGSTEEKAIARARAALLRFARRRVRSEVAAVVFVDEPYAKEVTVRKGRFRAEVCGQMDSRKLKQ